VGLLLSKGDGSFAAEKAVALPNVSFGFAVGDFDGDGHEDLATANIQAGVSVRHGNGDATFRDGGEITAGRGPVELAVGDFDGDGTEDLAIADPDGGTVSVRLGTSPSPLAGNLLVNGGFEQGLGVRFPADGPAVPGWTTTGGMTFAGYGAWPHRAFPSWIDAAFWSGGRNFL
jgi:hypothetical protein